MIAALALTGCKRDETSARASSSQARSERGVIDTNAALANADNTAVNIRDRAEQTLTPGDQGESAVDRDLTQKVRKNLGAGDYSVIARNIKIITVNGKVTLRGPVKTDAEKTAIVQLAKSVAGDSNVDDQLEVKAP
jgi:osmotically-inducible protein OsmY